MTKATNSLDSIWKTWEDYQMKVLIRNCKVKDDSKVGISKKGTDFEQWWRMNMTIL
jgi:hypothetical protein